MSEANIAFVVDDDNKPFCLIKRQPLADDRVAIMHSMNASWTKVLLYTSVLEHHRTRPRTTSRPRS